MGQRSNSRYQVVRRNSITEVDRAEWDQLAVDVYMSHGWLQTVEETFAPGLEHLYFMVLDAGALVGAAPCHVPKPTDDVFTLDDAIFGRFKNLARRLGCSMLPTFICGSLRGYGQHFIHREDLTGEQRQDVAVALMDAIEKEAAVRRLSVAFNNVMAQESDLIQLLQERGYGKTTNFPLNYVDIRWGTFAEYKRFLAKNKLVREINKNRKEGVTIEQLAAVGDHGKRLHQLLDSNFRKYNGRPLSLRDDFVVRSKELLGREAIIYSAIKNGNLVGTTIMFHRRGIAHISDVGVDHEACGNDFTYFNLVYYRPIADAIEMNIRRIYYGTMKYTMKAKRGSSTVDTCLFYRPRSRWLRTVAADLFAVHAPIKSWFIRRFHD